MDRLEQPSKLLLLLLLLLLLKLHHECYGGGGDGGGVGGGGCGSIQCGSRRRRWRCGLETPPTRGGLVWSTAREQGDNFLPLGLHHTIHLFGCLPGEDRIFI